MEELYQGSLHPSTKHPEMPTAVAGVNSTKDLSRQLVYSEPLEYSLYNYNKRGELKPLLPVMNILDELHT